MFAVAGKKLNNAETLKLSFLFLEAVWFYIWFVGGLGTGNTGAARGACEQWAHLGHRGSEAEQE